MVKMVGQRMVRESKSRAIKATWAQKVLRVRLVAKGQKATRGSQVLTGYKDLLDPKVFKGSKERLVLTALLGLKDLKVIPEQALTCSGSLIATKTFKQLRTRR
jgi:plasmid replication initiation protein